VTGKERVLRTFDGLLTDVLPWVPFTGVHAGRLVGFNATEVSTQVDMIVKAALEVNKLYKPDGQPVMFDLQIEAEVLGCELLWSDDGPPTVKSHPLAGIDQIPNYIPNRIDSRIKTHLSAIRALKPLIGEKTALYGICCGPFTLASHLRGTDIFMDMILDPEYVHSLLSYTNQVIQSYSTYLIEAGVDVVAVVDPLVSQISPAHFEEFMTSPFSELFDHIRSQDTKSSFFVCGNATMNIEPMCKTRPDGISVDENVFLPDAKKITDRYEITLGGNIPLTTIMLLGSQQDNMKATVDLIDSVSHSHLILSPGCDMPYDTPIENTIAVEHAVHETHSAREMVANYERSDIEFAGTLPDYDHLKRPLIEVFTIDPTTCAACTYMLAAAKDAVDTMSEDIDIASYTYNTLENIGRCRKMGITKLPSIYINGELAFSSIIPSREELIARMRKVL
jgi:uroporphyrinogen decarboxylase